MFGLVATDTQLYTLNTLAIMGFTSIPTMIVILIIFTYNIFMPIQAVVYVYRIYIISGKIVLTYILQCENNYVQITWPILRL